MELMNGYIGNEEFGNEVLNIVNMIKTRLSIKLKVDLDSIDNPEICELTNDDKDNDDGWGLKDNFKTAYQVLGEVTSRGYERIRKNFLNITPLLNLPSIYKLNKALPMSCVGCLFRPSKEERRNADKKHFNQDEKSKEKRSCSSLSLSVTHLYFVSSPAFAISSCFFPPLIFTKLL